jgi:hypothetical protein
MDDCHLRNITKLKKKKNMLLRGSFCCFTLIDVKIGVKSLGFVINWINAKSKLGGLGLVLE